MSIESERKCSTDQPRKPVSENKILPSSYIALYCCCCWTSPGLGWGGGIPCGGGPPGTCMTASGFIGGINAPLTRNSIILYHSGSTPAFSCSAVTCCKCPISFNQATRQLTFPCSSSSMPSSGDIGIGPGGGGGKRIPGGAIIGKFGSNLDIRLR
jgi:hypothetical protein